MNLTEKTFTYNEFKLLNKNLNFCPRPGNFNKNELNTDLLKFYRNLKLKAHFGNQEIDRTAFRPNKKSSWIPPKTPHVIETFITAVNNEIEKTKNKPIPKDNLTKEERKALTDLQQRTDIIITKAD